MNKTIPTPFIPFIRPTIDDEEIREVTRVLKSGILVGGQETVDFEAEFSDYLGVSPESAVSVSSATAGLHLCLVAMGIGPGDEVIVPTLTFSSTAEVVECVGATPILVDIDMDTFCLNLSEVKRMINENTKAIIPVHHSGRACDMGQLYELVHERGIKIIEDAAHAFSGKYKGKKIGTLKSDATVFSFYPNKTMTTGDGGMIISQNKHITQACRKYRIHGIRFGTPHEIEKGNLYDVETVGFKYNMTDIGAAIGRAQLKKVDLMRRKRLKHVKRYMSLLEQLPIILPLVSNEIYENHSWHLFTIRFRGSEANSIRNMVISLFQKEQIGFGIHYRPLHHHSHWKKNILENQTFKAANLFFESSLSLPLYPNMKDEAVDRVCKVIETLFR